MICTWQIHISTFVAGLVHHKENGDLDITNHPSDDPKLAAVARGGMYMMSMTSFVLVLYILVVTSGMTPLARSCSTCPVLKPDVFKLWAYNMVLAWLKQPFTCPWAFFAPVEIIVNNPTPVGPKSVSLVTPEDLSVLDNDQRGDVKNITTMTLAQWRDPQLNDGQMIRRPKTRKNQEQFQFSERLVHVPGKLVCAKMSHFNPIRLLFKAGTDTRLASPVVAKNEQGNEKVEADLETRDMSIREAMEYARSLPECDGFFFKLTDQPHKKNCTEGDKAIYPLDEERQLSWGFREEDPPELTTLVTFVKQSTGEKENPGKLVSHVSRNFLRLAGDGSGDGMKLESDEEWHSYVKEAKPCCYVSPGILAAANASRDQ
jgi:hypothetical protein